jgi:hypothetical protein
MMTRLELRVVVSHTSACLREHRGVHLRADSHDDGWVVCRVW